MNSAIRQGGQGRASFGTARDGSGGDGGIRERWAGEPRGVPQAQPEAIGSGTPGLLQSREGAVAAEICAAGVRGPDPEMVQRSRCQAGDRKPVVVGGGADVEGGGCGPVGGGQSILKPPGC